MILINFLAVSILTAGRLGSVPHLQQEGQNREATIASYREDEQFGDGGLQAGGSDQQDDHVGGKSHSSGNGEVKRLYILRDVRFGAEAARGLELLGAGGVAGIHLRGSERAKILGKGAGVPV